MSDQKEDSKYLLAGKAAFDWWLHLQPSEAKEQKHPDEAKGQKGDRAALARLRRAGTVSEALTDPGRDGSDWPCRRRHRLESGTDRLVDLADGGHRLDLGTSAQIRGQAYGRSAGS